MITSRIIKFLSTAALVVGFSTIAHAQATRTWVSGVGDDANPCSRTAPCKTFAGAISKTATNGEISVLDPGGFGAVTITKAITINGDGTLAGILSAGTNGIIVNITTNLATDRVVIRSISINGGGTGIDGVRMLDGKELVLDNVTITGVTGAAVDIIQTQGSNLFLKNVRITSAAIGVKTQSTSGAVAGTHQNTSIDGMTSHGVEAINNTTLVLDNVATTRCGGSGVRSEATSVNLTVENSISSGNNFGYEATAGFLRLSNCGMFYNNTNLTNAVLSAGNNRSAGNTTTNAPTAGGMTIN
jgi:hypothetical protein